MANPNVLAMLGRGVGSGVDYASKYADLDARQNGNVLQRLAIKQQQQKMGQQAEIDAAMRQAYQTADPQAAMMQSGIPSVVQAAQKMQSEAAKAQMAQRKAQLEAATKGLEIQRTLAGQGFADPSAANADAVLAQYQQATGQDMTAERKRLAGMDDAARKAYFQSKAFEAEKLLPKRQAVNTGGSTEFVDMNPLTNPEPQAIAMTATPGQVMATETARRGQDMTDARARAQMAQSASQFNRSLADRQSARAMASASGGVAGPGKPIKTTEGERNAAGYSLRMDEATGLIDKFEADGRPSYLTDIAGGIPFIGNAARRVAMSEAQQQYRQAQEDWVRAKLRKESGAVIGVEEMAAEIETYFPQPGDTAGVVAQKRRAREIANQAMRAAAGNAQITGDGSSNRSAASTGGWSIKLKGQ